MSRKQRNIRQVVAQTTLLVVGEGPDDKAFISHMKQLYCPRHCGISVKVEAQDGGSPGNIISNAIRSYRNIDYNRRILLLDADVPVSAADYKRAQKGGYEIILWRPQCLEGALLETLDERVQAHETSQQLKARLHPRLDGSHTEPKAYALLFTRAVLDAERNAAVAELRRVLLGP